MSLYHHKIPRLYNLALILIYYMQPQTNPLPLSTNPSSYPLYTPQWFWQSDSDPWKSKDPTKWTWNAYLVDLNSMIENAFTLNPSSPVDIGDYMIDLKLMMQYRKDDPGRMRRVKREVQKQLQSRLLLDLPEPKVQKTINEAFGTVQHFLSYVMNRTPESYNLLRRLEGLRLDCQQAEYQDVVDEVVSSIKKAEEARDDAIQATLKKTSLSSTSTTFKIKAQHVAGHIADNSATLKDFLVAVLKAYTMESFLYHWLNELLRSEDWTQINVLTPYLVCLAYIFQHPEYVLKYKRAKSNKLLFGLIITNKLTLYRGTALTEQQLAHYDRKKTQYFSWNGITSTSRNRKEAKKFVALSVQRAKPETKIGVLFIVHVDFSSQNDCEGMIDVAPYSQFQAEEEIILAPATVFEILSYKIGKDGIHKISLKVQKKFDDSKKKRRITVSLLGAFQDKIIQKDRAILHNMTKDEMIKALQLLEGNQFITRINITNCDIDIHLMQLIERTRATTNIPKHHITITNSQLYTSTLASICYYYSDESLNHICEHNQVWLEESKADVMFAEANYKIKNLCLSKKAFSALCNHGQVEDVVSMIHDQPEIRELDLEMDDVLSLKEVTLKNLLRTINEIPCVEKLSMSLERCKKNLSKIGMRVKQTRSQQWLAIDIRGCDRMNDSDLSGIADALKLTPSLQHLSLDLWKCNKISDQGVSSITNALRLTPSLQYLSLDLRGCNKVSDQGVCSIADALKFTPSLNYLSLDLWKCEKVSDQGVSSIADVLSFTPLQHLSLNLEWCEKVSDQGVSSIADALKLMPSLQYLSLDLHGCSNVSDQGVSSIADALRLTPSLQHLSLDLWECKKVSDQSVSSIADALSLTSSLQHLFINLE